MFKLSLAPPNYSSLIATGLSHLGILTMEKLDG